MKAVAIIVGLFLIPAASFAADQTSAGATSKLTAMLDAKGEHGKSIITPEERAYYDGLNDNLKALLDQAVQKEWITRPEHLSVLFSLGLRPQKMELLLAIHFSQSHRLRQRRLRT